AEWKNYKWNGVMSSNEISSLLNEENEFYDNTNEVNLKADPEEVRKEIQAQIDYSKLIGLNPTHIDTHMGSLAVNKNLWKVYIEVGHKNKLVSMVTTTRSLNLFDDDFPMTEYIVPVNDIYMLYPGADREFIESAVGENVANTLLVNDIYKYDDWYSLYSDKIKSLNPGLNVFLLHLGYDNEELKGVTIDHPEYGARWRQLDFEVFNSDEIKELLIEEGIKLVNWGEIRDIVYPN
ncbi:MAG: ChbG/HpnK family deacetylase, partial [Cryomorphaceae bacterium]|nr:ChbG/HpnK family deacetylase [Cryomorphaceae bacterium]